MGLRGELFSTKVSLQNRTYFFNVKENRLGDLYLNIVESKNRDEGGFERQSVILFADDLQEFLKGFDESLRVLEKSIRDKRRGPKNVSSGDKPPSRHTSDRHTSERQGERSRERFESAPRRKREDSPGKRFTPPGHGRKREEPRGFRSNDRHEKRDDRSARPYREKKDFVPRKKRVVVKKK